jgi:transcriptional regulator with XRE-family HTH domain
LASFTYTGLIMLGATLREARSRRGLSIAQLSKRSGVPGRLIREMEGGSPTYVPSELNTVLLSEALRVPAGPLLEERERLFEGWPHRDVVR